MTHIFNERLRYPIEVMDYKDWIAYIEEPHQEIVGALQYLARLGKHVPAAMKTGLVQFNGYVYEFQLQIQADGQRIALLIRRSSCLNKEETDATKDDGQPQRQIREETGGQFQS